MAEIKFCSHCGCAVEYRDAYGAVRPVCSQCGRVHFVDPKVAVGLILARDNHLLLVRRANDPEKGKWSIPAGFVDGGEDPARAAEREALEETGLQVRVAGLLDVYGRQGDTEGADILIVYLADVIGGALTPGDDAAECVYFSSEALPELAFASTLKVVDKWKTLTLPPRLSVSRDNS